MRKGNVVRRAFGWCDEHEKLLYLSRKQARQAARLHVGHKSAYECKDHHPGLWHVGGLPEPVVHGRLTRGEIFG